jgi:hypothetical protein
MAPQERPATMLGAEFSALVVYLLWARRAEPAR